MRNKPAGTQRPLPDVLLDHLTRLTGWDNNCYLTWVRADAEPEGSPWFTIRLTSDGLAIGFRLEFWVPEWMSARGAAAILPAHLALAECRTGEKAAVDLGMGSWPALKAGLPGVARMSARLINELWGLTEADDLLLLSIGYQDRILEAPFASLPGYG